MASDFGRDDKGRARFLASVRRKAGKVLESVGADMVARTADYGQFLDVYDTGSLQNSITWMTASRHQSWSEWDLRMAGMLPARPPEFTVTAFIGVHYGLYVHEGWTRLRGLGAATHVAGRPILKLGCEDVVREVLPKKLKRMLPKGSG
ncbi:MAG: hypothetical protein MH204_08085 [Fimbriimonadaceae bacterium]|nr:hypothetical protein [Fimbriimonadaceae bacterium]